MTYRIDRKVVLISAVMASLWPTTYTGAQDPAQGAPATNDIERVETDLNQLREDLRTARSSIENDIAVINAAQLRQIEAFEKASAESKSSFKLHWREIGWGDLLTLISIGIAFLVALMNLRKYFDAKEKEHLDREAESKAQSKDAQWKRITFLFEQAKLFHEDPKISKIIKVLSGQAQVEWEDIRSAIGTYNHDPTSVTAEQGDLLRDLDHFLDRLELISMAWSLDVLTTEEVGVFSSYLLFSIDEDMPVLKRYCEEHYPLVQDLAKAREEFEPTRAAAD